MRTSRVELSAPGWVAAGVAAVAAVLVALWLVPAALAQPAAPAGLSTESASEQVILSWTDPGDPTITGYQYRWSDDGDDTDWESVASAGNTDGWIDIAGSHAGTTSVKVTGLTNSTEYVFEVRALGPDGPDADNDPDPGEAASITATAGHPLTGFAATPGDEQVTLSWQNPGDSSITGYEYRQQSRTDVSGDYGDWGAFADLPGAGDSPSATSSTVTGLTNGTEYQIEIRAKVTAQGRESMATFVAGKPLTGLTATASGATATLKWSSLGTNNNTGYEYRQSTDGGDTWNNWGNPRDIGGDSQTNNALTTTFDVPDLTIGDEYTFQVRGTGGDYGASNMATVTVGNAIANFEAAAGNTYVILSWSNPGDPGVTGYAYRYSDDDDLTTWASTASGVDSAGTANTAGWVQNGRQQLGDDELEG